MITVRVPGTSANLGPGFDCFGIALGIYGYFGFEECEEGMCCVAYPIYDYTGRIIGGVSISGPTVRMNRVIRSSRLDFLKECAQRISKGLGYE